MPARRNKGSRARHGTKNLILQVLESTRTGPKVSTPDLIEKVQSVSGTQIPEPTIRAALRAQIEKGTVTARKKGRTMFLKLSVDAPTTSAEPRGRPGRKPKVDSGVQWGSSSAPDVATATKVSGVQPVGKLPEADQVAASPTPEAPVPVGTAPPSQALATHHKLAVGEAVILHVGEDHVETATNVHGKVVLERHPRPKR